MIKSRLCANQDCLLFQALMANSWHCWSWFSIMTTQNCWLFCDYPVTFPDSYSAHGPVLCTSKKEKKIQNKEAQKSLSCLRYITANALHTNEGCVLYILMMAMGYRIEQYLGLSPSGPGAPRP